MDDAATASSDKDEDDAENDGRFCVAVINKAQRRCELTTMGADLLRVDNASDRGFDGTWSHYTVLYLAADVSTVSGVWDAGLMTVQLPAASAGATISAGIV